jgi:hypothetical protein
MILKKAIHEEKFWLGIVKVKSQDHTIDVVPKNKTLL